jgi:rhodanese-related sulfurtransferase
MTYVDHPASDHRTVVDARTQLVDVRRPEEVAQGTLPGAINIPLDDLSERVAELAPTRRTVVLCRSGGRSAVAAQFLVDAGFADVVNLEGGMLAVADPLSNDTPGGMMNPSNERTRP